MKNRYAYYLHAYTLYMEKTYQIVISNSNLYSKFIEHEPLAVA